MNLPMIFTGVCTVALVAFAVSGGLYLFHGTDGGRDKRAGVAMIVSFVTLVVSGAVFLVSTM